MNDLRALLSPKSVAVIGASADFNKINGRPIRNLLQKGYRGKIYPVNPKYDRIGDLPCYPDVNAIEGPVDLAVVILPAGAVIGTFDELGKKKVPAAVVFSAGFGETGEKGKALEAELLAKAKAYGIRLCGPNCLGLINAFDGMLATFSQYADGENLPGPIAFVTQSGAFGTAISALARNRSLGLGFFVNTGNETDVDFVDAMSALIEDPRIRVGTGYIEGLKRGKEFARLGKRSLETGKPIVVMKVGRTAVGSRAAESHTGALAGEDAVFDGVARQYGFVRARNEEELLDLAQAFAFCALPEGRGVAIATQSGGAGVQMADRADDLGLVVPVLGKETQAQIAKTIPGFGVATNPIDVTGQFVANPAILRESLILMLTDPAVHIGVVWIELMHANVDLLVRVFEEVKEKTTKPFVIAWVAAPPSAVEALARRGIALLRSGEAAIEAVAGLVRFAEEKRAFDRAIPSNSGDKSADAAGPAKEIAEVFKKADATSGLIDSQSAMDLLSRFGLEFAQTVLVKDYADLKQAVRHLRYPLALKVESPDIAHKTDIGGVMLNIADGPALDAAWQAVSETVKKKMPQARITGMLIQEMAVGDLEFVIGIENDRVFGPVIMAGVGGVFIEALRDVAFRQCPIDKTEALAMLGELKAKPLFHGLRARPAIDCDALAGLIAQISRFGAQAAPWLASLDVNPIMLGGSRRTAVDCLLLAKTGGPHV